MTAESTFAHSLRQRRPHPDAPCAVGVAGYVRPSDRFSLCFLDLSGDGCVGRSLVPDLDAGQAHPESRIRRTGQHSVQRRGRYSRSAGRRSRQRHGPRQHKREQVRVGPVSGPAQRNLGIRGLCRLCALDSDARAGPLRRRFRAHSHAARRRAATRRRRRNGFRRRTRPAAWRS